MNLIFDAPKRSRLHRYFIGVHVEEPKGKGMLWFSYTHRRWQSSTEGHCTNLPRCRTLRAFKSHLRRHARELAGSRVTLVNHFEDHNITVQL